MKRIIALIVLGLLAALMSHAAAEACSDIFVNHPKTHIAGRNMDFGMNISHEEIFGFIGQKSTTDVVIDAAKVPAQALTSWTNRYGYWGRGSFHTPKVVEGMNTAGLTLGALYLAGITQYPAYDPGDKRPVIGFFDLGNYLLSQAGTVAEALSLIAGHQIVQSAVEIQPGVFLRDVPLHFSIRDAAGRSAVVESVGGRIQVYPDAGNVMTNDPAYPEQLAKAQKYTAIDAKKGNGSLTGIPGSFSSTDRFARGAVLLANLPVPYSRQEALYQANFVLTSLASPSLGLPGRGNNSSTIWKVIKDLDQKIVYVSNTVYFQGGGKIAPTNLANGYEVIDLNAIDFQSVPTEFAGRTIQPTPADRVRRIVAADDIPEFSR